MTKTRKPAKAKRKVKAPAKHNSVKTNGGFERRIIGAPPALWHRIERLAKHDKIPVSAWIRQAATRFIHDVRLSRRRTIAR